MTTQPEAGSSEQQTTSASQITKPWRELIALVLVGANAVLLFVGLIDLLVPYSANVGFSSRAGGSFFDFVGIEAIVLPLVAVLLATHIKPPVPRAKLITQAALIEYAVSAVFGVIALLAWLFGSLVDGEVRAAFTGLLVRVAYAGIFAVAGFLIYKIWRTLYYVPRPKPQPGVYGAPAGGPGGYPPAGPGPMGQGQQGYGQPQAYGQPGYPPPPAYPGATPGLGGPAAPGAGQPAPGPGAAPGQTGAIPPGGAAPSASAPSEPATWPPVPGAPQATQTITAPPVSGAPAPAAPAAPAASPHDEPTAAIPTPEGERTQVINPASQQPSAGSAPPPAATATGDEPTRPDIR
ncbi:hypothetical protein O7635_03690 [Asanoa sp. WMMD1127]|uniref:hypothetical protein n=1 Tax=Asanoa sp. WMMD1127 TaxID=3016107 RepID=UPI0024170DCF|nr:hypothetical protein [Asanoa sp. WMMD1127]MDG4820955.1 hypothetical protein [Asanoa sp. WMMD1127]